MNNDKDLFSQIDNLFESASIDEANELISEQLAPTTRDYEKDLIEKLNRNQVLLQRSKHVSL